jgi:hypothetical protein
MAGYLDQYGAGEEQRNTIIFRTVAALVVAAILASLGWYLFKNRHQEMVVKNFLNYVRRGDFQAAYRAWGCHGGRDCAGYPFDKFLSDWGPGSNGPDPATLRLSDSESCNNGVLLTVNVNPNRQEVLWVDKGSDSISFAPYPVCPHKSSFSIMIHRTVGQLRKPLLQ